MVGKGEVLTVGGVFVCVCRSGIQARLPVLFDVITTYRLCTTLRRCRLVNVVWGDNGKSSHCGRQTTVSDPFQVACDAVVAAFDAVA